MMQNSYLQIHLKLGKKTAIRQGRAQPLRHVIATFCSGDQAMATVAELEEGWPLGVLGHPDDAAVNVQTADVLQCVHSTDSFHLRSLTGGIEQLKNRVVTGGPNIINWKDGIATASDRHTGR